jgi:hypothetical protein
LDLKGKERYIAMRKEMSPWFSPEPPHPSVMFQGKGNQEASEIKSIKENYVYQKHIKKS